MGKILVIDDEEYIGWVIKKSFEATDNEVYLCQTAKDGLAEVKKKKYDIVFLDLRLPDMDGMEVLLEIKKMQLELAVIIITAHGSIDTAIESMKKGAFDYITKPFDVDELLLQADKALEMIKLKGEVNYLRNENIKELDESKFISNNENLNKVFKTINHVAQTDATVLITGEIGTGKELVARRIHQISSRANYPFVVFKCSAIAENLIESELFGCEEEAFNGAIQKKIGKLEIADKGTIFLDGVDEMSLNFQAKFLKMLQEKEFQRMGIDSNIKVDVRIIAATNKNLISEVQAGNFREDLYYTLNVVPIELPPLRERREDIKGLIDNFIKQYDRLGKIKDITPEALNLLKNYYWPGNIRELKNVIERIVILNEESCIRASSLPQEILGQIRSAKDPIIYFPEEGINLEKVEKELIVKALKLSEQNQSKAAQLLGITRSALIYRMQKFMIN